MHSKLRKNKDIPVGTRALILSKLYFGVLSKSLEDLEIERYFSVLYFLNENNGCSQQFICNHLAIDKTAMVKVLDYLIKAGYVLREINTEDRREHIVILTKKGQKYTAEIVKSFDEIDEQIFSTITKQDRIAFTRVLSTLSENLKLLPGNDLQFNYKKTRTLSKNNRSLSITKLKAQKSTHKN
ncbi:hypothetical protein CNR22_24070 [Sphingobacteriaceae bacterium]|nr:hypothetical protein CNR22_24070 [Sphingobacteriaceae bacterium]